MSDKAVSVVKVGGWKVGYDHKNKKTLLVLEFSDREPLAFAIEPNQAADIGRAMIQYVEAGQSSPHRPN